MRLTTGMLWPALSLIAFLGACSQGERIVVYSPHGPEIREAFEQKFEAANPGIDVQILNMSSQEAYNKIYAERNRPVCDVWWGAPSTMFTQAAEQGLLAPYEPSWSDKIEPSYRDQQHRWYGSFRLPIVIIYNDTHYEEGRVPQTWEALLEPEWNQKIAMRRPLESGTLRTFIGAMVQRGETVEAGFDYLRDLHRATAVYLEKPQFMFDHLKRNPERISIWLLTDAMLQRELNGYPFWFAMPPEVPVLTDCIALIDGAPNEAAAKKFYEFVTSQEAMVELSQKFAKIPARHDIPRDQMPQWMTAQEINAIDIDWEVMAEQNAAWCERWEEEIFRAIE